jgi:5-methylcytosine-specific restriction endonuclease McrA
MGLPRYLETKFSVFLNDTSPGEKLLCALCSGADYGAKVFDVLNPEKQNKKAPRDQHVIWGFVRARWAYFEFRRYRKNEKDYMEHAAAKFYRGLETLPSGACVAESREVKVPRYFLPKLEQLNSERESNDRRNAELVKKIALLRNKVYASRCFPAHLRSIIFDRDAYRCQLCLRDREILLGLGLHLEVDHILPYIDGGKTTYSNGRTLCNECNVAKHCTKGYLNAIEALEGKARSI